jgi:hypothetical protein
MHIVVNYSLEVLVHPSHLAQKGHQDRIQSLYFVHTSQ